MSRQVRLDDDVVDALVPHAEDAGLSLAAYANRTLRSVVVEDDDAPHSPVGHAAKPVTRDGAPPAHAPEPSGRASVTPAPRGRNGCRHPVNRRIGNSCAACGKTLR